MPTIITPADLDEEVAAALRAAVDAGVASKIFQLDATLWGPDAESESAIRLGWTHADDVSRPLVADILRLKQELSTAGVSRIVLCGMGGSSLAPEVICASAGVDLVVLDSSDPDMVRSALVELDSTAVVVSSKSGGTVETDSQKRVFEAAFTAAGIDPTTRIVVVTDPGSPLDSSATEAGYRVFRADPNVGGRYSALTAFGLVPSGLAGADIARLLDEAAAAAAEFAADGETNAALVAGVQLGQAAISGFDKMVVVDEVAGRGLGDWAEQLVAESTGKDGKGILPVVVAGPDSPNFDPPTPDAVLVTIGDDRPLGAQFLLWEVATAVAGRIIGINPFDQPDVESAKAAARELLGGGSEPAKPDATDGGIDLFGSSADTVESALEALLAEVSDTGYLAVQVYLDRWKYALFSQVRDALADRLERPVTFGWGPRFLHSTGQYHKGGTPNGVFLQITGEPEDDLAIAGRDFTLGSFIASQAAGDAKVLRDHGRPVLSLHLHDQTAGLDRLRDLLS